MLKSPLHKAHPGTVVTANRRVSQQLRLKYDRERRQQGAQVWEAVDILPIEAWKARLWREQAERDPINTPVLLSQVQERVLWREVIRRSAVASELLDLPSTAVMAARARDLIFAWNVRRDRAAFGASADTEAFWDWLTYFEDQLRAQNWVTRGELAVALPPFCQSSSPISYAGFAEIAPADRRLLEACGASEHATWAPINQPNLSRRPAAGLAQELEQAAAWVRAKLSENSHVTLGVIVPALASAAPMVERIFDDVLHPSVLGSDSAAPRAFEIASGIASNEVPVVATALLVLGLHSGLTQAEAGGLLRSPFLSFDRVRGAEIDGRLRRYRKHVVRLEDVAELFPRIAKVLEKRLEGPRNRRPSEWSAAFSALVQAAGWREQTSSRRDQQSVEHWKDLLSDLASLDRLIPRLTYGEALSELRSIARDSRFHPENHDLNEDAPVPIMDLHEAASASMNFDGLWIAGLHAGVWPEPPQPNPFLPLALQVDLPHGSARWELEHAQRVTTRLLASAGEVVCSFPRLSGEEELRASPLIEHLPLSPLMEFAPTVLQTVFATPMMLEELRDAPVPVDAARNAFMGGASVLKAQAACPFQAFAMYRLGARELDEEEIGVSPRERGSAVHVALELLWEKLHSSNGLKELSSRALAELIEDVAQRALEKIAAPPRFRNLELRRLTGLLGEWLEFEKSRPDFAVVAHEADRVAEIGGIRLSIRPDRVDRYDAGGYVVIDYKTGKDLKETHWDGERPKEPQLPLYAVKSGHAISEVMFARLIPGEIKPIARGGDKFEQSRSDWERVLEQLASNFAGGEVLADPRDGALTCRLCRLQSLCRVDELRAFDEDGDEEDSRGE